VDTHKPVFLDERRIRWRRTRRLVEVVGAFLGVVGIAFLVNVARRSELPRLMLPESRPALHAVRQHARPAPVEKRPGRLRRVLPSRAPEAAGEIQQILRGLERATSQIWVIDRAQSGGGPLLNLGIHFVDLCRVLLGNAELTVTGAMMSNRAAGLTIEDHAVMLMQGGGASCMVESGYLYPAPNSVFDLHYSIRTEKHYFAARDNSTLEIVTNDRQRTTREMKLTNVFFYPEFVRDTLRRVRDGRPPIADLSDNAAAVALIEAAYHMSPLQQPTR